MFFGHGGLVERDEQEDGACRQMPEDRARHAREDRAEEGGVEGAIFEHPGFEEMETRD